VKAKTSVRISGASVLDIVTVHRRLYCPGINTMTIDWTSFTLWTSLAGGALIRRAMFVLLNSRIAGIGVLGSLLKPVQGDVAWRAAFIARLVAAPLL
jgi:hypothetical protein